MTLSLRLRLFLAQLLVVAVALTLVTVLAAREERRWIVRQSEDRLERSGRQVLEHLRHTPLDPSRGWQRLALALVMSLQMHYAKRPAFAPGVFLTQAVARLARSVRRPAHVQLSVGAHALGNSGTQSSCKNVSTCKMFLVFCKRPSEQLTDRR